MMGAMKKPQTKAQFKAKLKKRISVHYRQFVKEGLTIGAACKRVENEIARHTAAARFFHVMRGDMSTRLSGGKLRIRFNPDEHTHEFENL